MVDVSVLLPVRDGGLLLERAIASVLEQRGVTFELVAVNDGSTDDTWPRLKDLAANDGRVRALRTPPRGIVSALNTGLDACRGTVIVRQDHDDVSRPGRLAALHDLIASGQADVGDTELELEASGSTSEGMERWIRWHRAVGRGAQTPALHRYVDAPLSALACRADLLRRLGGYRDLGWNEDHDLILRAHHAGARLGRVPQPLYVLNDRPERLSRRDTHAGAERLRALKASFLARHELRLARARGREIVIWGAARNGKRMARALRAEGVPVGAFVELDRRKIGKRIAGARVISPAELPPREAAFVLIAVGSDGAREEITDTLRGRGFAPEDDHLAVC